MAGDFTFPSARREEKFPLVALADDSANDLINWLHDHPEIDRRVPPIYRDFRLRHKSDGCVYDIFVHYREIMTAFEWRLKFSGRAIMTGLCDYEYINGTIVHSNVSASGEAAEKYGEEWIRQTACAVVLCVVGAQSYMLYFKPELVEQIYTPRSKPTKRSSTTRRRSTAEPVTLRPVTVKRIYLDSREKEKKKINWQKMSWFVRGHYRRVGKDKHLKYVQPFTCNRAGKNGTAKTPKYKIIPPSDPHDDQSRDI